MGAPASNASASASSTAAPPSPPVTGLTLGALIALTIFWCAFILFADAHALGALRRQLFEVRSLAEAPGRILESRVDERHGDDTTYGVAVRYEFEVDGVRHEGTTFRLAQLYTSNRDAAAREVARLPRGAAVNVLYAPKDPTLSTLRSGSGGSEWFFAFFLTPFNMVGVGLAAACVSLLRARRLGPGDPGRAVIDEGDRVRLVLGPLPPWGSACGAVALVSFVVMLVVGLGWSFSPPAALVFLSYILTGAAGLAAYVYARRRATSGRDDLVIDRRAGRVYLPMKAGERERVACAVSEVAEVVVTSREETDSEGDAVTRFEPALRVRAAQGDPATRAITLVSEEADARRIARWTEARLREAGAALEGDRAAK